MGDFKGQSNRLQETILQNEKDIRLLKERVIDLRASRKGILKQKNALEETVRAFSNGHDGAGEVAALSNSLSALIGEKKRTEAELKESRKKIVVELLEARREIESLQRDLSRKDALAARQVEEIKSKLIVEQHAREMELQNHTSTLKELQKRLFEERTEKTKLLNEKEEANSTKGYPEARNGKPPPGTNGKTVSADEINRLRKEMQEMEHQHRQQLEKAEHRAAEAEKRSMETQEIQESRVVNLEHRLEELSDSVANYDRQRHEDQISIAKLRERIAQLDTENCALTHVRRESTSLDEDESDLHSLVEKIIRLRSELRERNAQCENPISDIEAYFYEEKRDVSSTFTDEEEDWKAKYFKLVEDFEALQKKSSSHGNAFQKLMNQEEISSLRAQNGELIEKVSRLQSSLSLAEEGKGALERRVRELNSQMNASKLSMGDALQSKEVEMRNKTLTLESELVKQRDRFILSMQEKDEELKNMRDNLEMAIDNGFVSYMNRKSSTNMDNITERLSLGTEDEGRMMIHFSEETGRKDKEIAEFREQIRDLESGMREIQARFISKEEDYVSEGEALRDKISVLQRMSKSDFNVEYLKNVVVNYMLSSDISSKEHMLNAIAAVLVFSEKEVKRVKAFNSSWFWKKS